MLKVNDHGISNGESVGVDDDYDDDDDDDDYAFEI
jgi:hypothetical protein